MHRVGAADVAEGAVDVAAAEQFLFGLPEQGGTELGVAAKVGQGLVEPLRDDGQAAGRVDDVAGSFLDEEQVIGWTSMVGGARDGGEGQDAPGAEPVGQVADCFGRGEVGVAEREGAGSGGAAFGERVDQFTFERSRVSAYSMNGATPNVPSMRPRAMSVPVRR